MKLTFVYNNRKTFTASNVVENSLGISRDSEGRPHVSYQKVITVDSEKIVAAVANILPRPAEFKQSGIVSQLMDADAIFYDTDIYEAVEIDATAAGLVFIIVSESADDDTYMLGDVVDYNVSDYVPVLAVIPVLSARVKPVELADALTLFF